MPKPFSGELGEIISERFRDPRSRTLLPVWDGVGKSLQLAMNEYARTQRIDTVSHDSNGCLPIYIGEKPMTAIIQDVNLLAPFEIWEVPLDHSTIKFYKPLILVPTWMPHDPDEPGDIEYIEVENPELWISSYGKNRDELLRGILCDIRITWQDIVKKNNSLLCERDLLVKNNYLAIAEEIEYA